MAKLPAKQERLQRIKRNYEKMTAKQKENLPATHKRLGPESRTAASKRDLEHILDTQDQARKLAAEGAGRRRYAK